MGKTQSHSPAGSQEAFNQYSFFSTKKGWERKLSSRAALRREPHYLKGIWQADLSSHACLPSPDLSCPCCSPQLHLWAVICPCVHSQQQPGPVWGWAKDSDSQDRDLWNKSLQGQTLPGQQGLRPAPDPLQKHNPEDFPILNVFEKRLEIHNTAEVVLRGTIPKF